VADVGRYPVHGEAHGAGGALHGDAVGLVEVPALDLVDVEGVTDDRLDPGRPVLDHPLERAAEDGGEGAAHRLRLHEEEVLGEVVGAGGARPATGVVPHDREVGLGLVPGVDEAPISRLAPRAEDHGAGAVAEEGGAEPRPRVPPLHVERDRVAGQVAAGAVAGHEEDRAVVADARQLAAGRMEGGGEAGAAQVVVHEVGVGPQSQLPRHEAQVVVEVERVRRAGDVDQGVDVRGLQPRILQGALRRPHRQVAVVEAPFGPRPLDGGPHVEVEGARRDAEVPLQPVRLDRLPVGLGGPEPGQDFVIPDEGRADERARTGDEGGTAHRKRL